MTERSKNNSARRAACGVIGATASLDSIYFNSNLLESCTKVLLRPLSHSEELRPVAIQPIELGLGLVLLGTALVSKYRSSRRIR